MTKRIVFLDSDTLGPSVNLRMPITPSQWVNYPKTLPNEAKLRLSGAHIAVTNKVKITREMLNDLPDIEIIAVAATGTNVIDIDACKSAGITVCNIKNYGATTVSEHTMACILSLQRNLISYREEVLEGRWQDEDQFCFYNSPMNDLRGSTLGIIGTGAIACAAAELAQGFGMIVIMHSLSGRKKINNYKLVSLNTLLETSDVISLHCPLTLNSQSLIDAESIEKMSRTPLLINTARGVMIDLNALETALDQGRIRGAAIDVAETEPPTKDSLLMKLAKRRNVLITPHIAWASLQARQTLANQLIDNIDAYCAGSPQNVVSK